MNPHRRLATVVFAQVPPPEHGQSRMVALALGSLRDAPRDFEVYHVNARFSDTLDDIGGSSLRKLFLCWKYLLQAIRIRFQCHRPLLYYVPGPVKWSAVLRDWLLLTVLRCFYHRVIFHWHAIGQGEWAHGSTRIALEGPRWIDAVARRISAWVLESPLASIAVSPNSQRDAPAIRSKRVWVIPNGLADPCENMGPKVASLRHEQRAMHRVASHPCFRILFVSHGTMEKGTLDALAAMETLLDASDPSWRFAMTFAGGISEAIRPQFDDALASLIQRGKDRIAIREVGYLSGDAKQDAYFHHDIFLAPSRWESFGLTVVEAMAYGMPVVAAASDGVSGILPEGYPHLAPVGETAALGAMLHSCCRAMRTDLDPGWGAVLREHFLDHYQISPFNQELCKRLAELEPPAPEAISSSVGDAVEISTYLADQNPGHDRSFGISRMTQVVLEALQAGGSVRISTIASKTSQQAPPGIDAALILPWGTRNKWVRLLTDHLHPLYRWHANGMKGVCYFPKGYLPWFDRLCRPSVVTIHDTIIQYDEDHYPHWRSCWEYAYWAAMLKHTLRQADALHTVSKSSRQQILAFMDRHGIPRKEIHVTYEPCLYEAIAQPDNPPKQDYVIHLASFEPHKRTSQLVRWWHEAETHGRMLPTLHLIGTVPKDVAPLLSTSRSIVNRPFLDDLALQAAYRSAKALILPSEIEGFGLPALEAYYLGTPVCFVRGTSVEEILSVATAKGGFALEDPESLWTALAEVMCMEPDETRACGLKLRENYASSKVAEQMLHVFREVAAGR